MGFVTSVYQLFVLRSLMGLVTGFVPTSLAMISAQTPKETAGKTLGTPQMGQVSGTLFGPMLGRSLTASGLRTHFLLRLLSFSHPCFSFYFRSMSTARRETKQAENLFQKTGALLYFSPARALGDDGAYYDRADRQFQHPAAAALYVNERTDLLI